MTTGKTSSSTPPALPDEEEHVWHGSGPLWVDLGNFTDSFARQDGTIRIKYAWWTGDDSGASAEIGPPTVSAEPLDGGDPIAASFGGYATTGTEQNAFSWWPTTLDFPAPGCWKLTGQVNDVTVDAIVNVTESS